MAGKKVERAAKCKGVLPFAVRALISAPCVSSRAIPHFEEHRRRAGQICAFFVLICNYKRTSLDRKPPPSKTNLNKFKPLK